MSIVRELRNFAKNLTVMIVEDDKQLNEEIVNLAELFFKDVSFAYNGIEALEIYKHNPADIVITDITMPKMDGVVLSKKLKEINENQDIVIISAHRDMEFLVKLVDIGIKQLVYKPFDHQELIYRLLRVCEDKVLSLSLHTNVSVAEPKPALQKSVLPKNNSVSQKEKTALLDISDDMSYEIEYLIELGDELEHEIDNLYYGVNAQSIEMIASLLSKIYTTLSQMGATANIAVVIYEMSNFLSSIHLDTLTKEQKEKFVIMKYIGEDIVQFISSAFITQELSNISLIENSLRASLEQLKQNVFDGFLIEEDLELF